MDFDLSCQLPYPGTDFEQFVLNGVKLRFCKLSVLQVFFSKCVQQDVGDAVQEQPELVCFKI